MFKKAVREAAVIIVAATVLALVVYAARPDKIGETLPPGTGGTSVQATDATGRSDPVSEMPREISLERAKQLYDSAGAIFADARHPVDFAAGHIRDAQNLCVADEAAWLPDFVAATDPSRVIIAYCDGENCHLAPELGELLYFNGFDNVYYLKNGWSRWRQHGFPVILPP